MVGFRIAAFDLDETVFRDGAFVPGLDVGLGHLRQLGVRPMLVTGRSSVAFRHVGPVPDGFDHRILLSNGNAVLHRAYGRVETSAVLPGEVLSRLVADDGRDLVAETADELLASTGRAAVAHARAYRLPRSAITVDPARVAGAAATAVTVYGAPGGPGGLLAGAAVEVDRITAYHGYVLRPSGTCKARAVSQVVAGGDLSRVIAFGDGYNDACLLAAAGRGVAVDGADEVATRHSRVRLDRPLPEYLLGLTTADGPDRRSADAVPPPSGTPCRGVHRNPVGWGT